MQFIDEARIHIESGKGGNGAVSFRREKNVPRGGPDGGDGGRGGDVIFKCTTNLNTLVDFRYKQHFKAENGVSGKGRNKSGKYGEDLVIIVPFGTQIFKEDELLVDMIEDGQEFIAANGGKGGLGNINYKSSVNQAPKYAQQGQEAQEFWVELRLKLLSDVGVIGLPNAGKSTFLSVCTRAKPKIADYPFTTLVPQLGVTYIDGSEFVIADIPGLIKGASLGKGLGDRFLKHVERCRTLLHVIDCSSDDVARDYKVIREELESYSPELAEKPEVVTLSKIDIIEKEELQEKITALQEYLGGDIKIYCISSATQDGIDEVLRAIWANVKVDDNKQDTLTKTPS